MERTGQNGPRSIIFTFHNIYVYGISSKNTCIIVDMQVLYLYFYLTIHVFYMYISGIYMYYTCIIVDMQVLYMYNTCIILVVIHVKFTRSHRAHTPPPPLPPPYPPGFLNTVEQSILHYALCPPPPYPVVH